MTASCISTLNPAPRDANVENALVLLSVKEEFRACFLKREDPKALMAKHGVNVAVVKKWLVEVIKERSEERQLKFLATERAFEYYTAIQFYFNQYEAKMKQFATLLRDYRDFLLKLDEKIVRAFETLRHTSRSVDELDEASKLNREFMSSLIKHHINVQKVLNNTKELLRIVPQLLEKRRREPTLAREASFDAKKLEIGVSKELEDLKQMVFLVENIGNQTASPVDQKSDAASANQKISE